MKIFKTKKGTLVYHPTPKCGCTSMKQTILNLAGYKGKYDPIEDSFPHAKSSIGLPTEKFYQHNADYKICIIRNPVSRFISGYSNRVLFHRDIKPVEFDLFIDNFSHWRKTSPSINFHFRPQIHFIGSDPNYYTNIFWTKEIPKAIDFVSSLFEKNAVYVREQTGGSNQKPVPTEQQIEKIKRIYSKDYEFIEKWRKNDK